MISDDPNDDFEGDFDDLQPAKKFAGKKLVLFVALPLLLLAGGGAALVMGGFLDSKDDKKAAVADKTEEHQPVAAATVFYDLPVLLVNLNTSSRRPSFLKIKISLELDSAAHIARIDSVKPRIIDNFQTYLRELRIDDLRGSAGIYRLREELLARVNASVRPAGVKNVLFKEVLVQ